MSGQRLLARSVSGKLSLLGRLCLMASLWRAPVPMIHTHDSDIDQPSVVQFVREHLAKFHSDVPVNSHVDFGWHIHFVFLNGTSTDEPFDRDGGPDHSPVYDPFIVCQAEMFPTFDVTFEGQVLYWGPVRRVVGRARVVAPATPSQFLGTYLDSVSLRTLLRVLRC